MGLPARAALLYHRLPYVVKARGFPSLSPMYNGHSISAQRMLPFWPMAIEPGCGQYVKPWGFAPVSMVVITSPVAVSMTETDP